MAKEAKSVRAAALSVGIFMMTGAGAVPVFSSPTDGPLSGRSFVHLKTSGNGVSPASGNLGLIRFAVNDVAPRPPTHSEALWTQSGTGFEAPGVDALLVEGGFNVADSNTSVFGVVSFDATSTDTPKPGTYTLAITGLATLPFIRRRRLGPVPFE